jgi:hypothetical protein
LCHINRVLLLESCVPLFSRAVPILPSIAKMSIAEWDNEYARLARAASQMRTTGILTGSGDVRSLQQGLQRLDGALDNLPLQQGEIQRRRRLIHHLQQTSTGTTSSSGGGGGGQQQQQSQMSAAMRQQDDMIDELAVGVNRLKHQTIAIGDEAKLHVNLLSDMETNLDTAYAGLEGETRRAAQLKEDSSIWRLQLIVAGLSVLLILLILLGLSP